MSRTGAFLFVCLAACLLLLSGPSGVSAHTFNWDIGDFELGLTDEMEHTEDTNDPGGWVNISINNNGSEAWGDFHMYFFEVPYYDISNLHWTDADSSQIFTNDIDNDAVGATLDFYFYNDPVLPGETATFSGYSDNQDAIAFFGVGAYPTPVPIPEAVWLLGAGLVGLAGFRKKS